ncbi:MAG: hypothetical protein Q9209_001859 [Squamulea sp. 1 TL-2023]
MAYSNSSGRIRLALLLQEAHDQQKCNTRILEESYHALRTSTRRLELCWMKYCNELERELDVSNWKDITRGPTSVEEIERYQPELNANRLVGDKFPDLPSADSDSWQPPTHEPPSPPHARPRSNDLQTPQPQHLTTTVQGPREIPTPTHIFPLRYNTTPYSRPKLAPSELQGPQPVPASTINIPKRHASLPTREFLVALNQQPRQEIPSTSYHRSPADPNRPPTPHPQHRNSHKAGRAHSVDIPPPLPKLPHAYSNSNANESTGKTYTVEGFKPPVTHETFAYEPGVYGHGGSPSNGENAAMSDADLTRKHRSGGRARLHKRRKSEIVGRN